MKGASLLRKRRFYSVLENKKYPDAVPGVLAGCGHRSMELPYCRFRTLDTLSEDKDGRQYSCYHQRL